MDECQHGMKPEWCAICLKHSIGDEPEEIVFKGILDKYEAKE
jgi:hypothetical protein